VCVSCVCRVGVSCVCVVTIISYNHPQQFTTVPLGNMKFYNSLEFSHPSQTQSLLNILPNDPHTQYFPVPNDYCV
jgi:hypothetical protein